MNCSKSFEELSKALHERSFFDCGEKELNLFIRTQALRHMNSGISRTFVLPATSPSATAKLPICSFYTIAPATIRRETLPGSLAKKLPHYPVQVFLLAQLAVDKQLHGSGLGKITLVKALQYLWEVNKHMPAYAVIVDCLTDNAENFYKKFGFENLCIHNERKRMFISMKTLKAIFYQ